MIILESVLLGIVASLIALKLGLLAAATVLFVYGLTVGLRKRTVAPALLRVKRQKLDEYA
jgi:hypothetical protein